ncbi:uncharacterized protein LOC102806526 [Saccoglossus kowalevskii]|uniref:Uncharacterized protein LOC102806526 n=1 Tax=Saccoglossus kowalevskii TaxID=10224 RepID=A0ABM0MF19_SACKO|nr:PREDICTED: uncharacterized protein LOC102806526 [Saccoglossus kowalevskii]
MGQHRQPRLPFTANIVAKMCSALSKGIFTPFTDVLLQAVVSVAFIGFLRCGEFTTENAQFDKNVNLCLEDVSFCSSDKVLLKLKTSKTDPLRKGTVLTLFKNNRFCPVTALQQYIAARKRSNYHNGPSDPLFISEDGLPLTRACFLHLLRSLLNTIGVDSSKYSGHSFRIGAASSAAHAGIQDHMIKTLGRWTSDTYNRYIRVADDSIYGAQSALAYSM